MTTLDKLMFCMEKAWGNRSKWSQLNEDKLRYWKRVVETPLWKVINDG